MRRYGAPMKVRVTGVVIEDMAEDEVAALRDAFFAKDQACLRSSRR